jgi:electron transfer flavoprotein alpha subunit
MAEILALVEHRQGAIRDVSYELMTCGRKLAEKTGTRLTAVLLGHNTGAFVESLKPQAHRVIVADHEIFKDFNAESYQKALAEIIKTESPLLTLIGHTASGMSLCPALGSQLGLPFTTDCLDVDLVDGKLTAIRQMYEGKLDARVKFRESPSYILTLRTGGFPAEDSVLQAEIVDLDLSEIAEPSHLKFLEYIEAAVGDVDITKADILVGIGRGIREKDNLASVEEFADMIGGVLACTRPVVDAEWLPKDRQVGSSGKTVKPKLYIALGISGAFQHIAGMKGADTIIAVNKDPEAPIFNEADYGIVDDLFKVLPALKSKITELKH